MDIAFFLLRPHRIVQDLVLDRSAPDLRRLERIRSPESFVWKILSHAARTFSACILFLPSQIAISAAIAYLYCRILDTYEDLVPDPRQREAMLEAFTHRFKQHPKKYTVFPAPSIDDQLARNAVDRLYTLLVNRCRLLDAVFAKLKVPFQRIIVDLVKKMAGGMLWSSQVFESQGGVLTTSEQLSRYCHNVLGNPTVFAVRLMNLFHHKSANLSRDLHRCALEAGEFIQLANITRDIESDLKRKIAYHPALKQDLGRRDIFENRSFRADCRGEGSPARARPFAGPCLHPYGGNDELSPVESVPRVHDLDAPVHGTLLPYLCPQSPPQAVARSGKRDSAYPDVHALRGLQAAVQSDSRIHRRAF